MDATDEGRVVTVDAVTENGTYLNELVFAVNLIAPDGTVEPLTLPQIAPGRYQGTFDPGETGVYLLRFDGVLPEGGDSVAAIAGWVQAYSPEYGLLESRPGFLEDLSTESGGALLALENVIAPFARPETPAASARPLWPELLTAALVLLPFDIAVRRLALERRDLLRIWKRLSARFILRPATATAGVDRPSRVESLLRAKERVEEKRVEAPKPVERRLVAPSEPQQAVSPPLVRPAPGKPDHKPEPPDKPDQPDAGEEGQTTTAALLAKKRARNLKK
jgi:hypothetical protein